MSKLVITILALIVLSILILLFMRNGFHFQFKEPKITPPSTYSAWIPYWDQQRVIQSIELSHSKLEYLSPMWYKINPVGKFDVIDKGEREKISELAKQNKLDLIPLITNELDPKRVGKFLNDGSLQENFINESIVTAQKMGYKGFDLDFEGLNLADKDKFSSFIKDFSEKLHQNGLKLYISVHAQTGKNSDWASARAQDWKVISKYADFISIMAYDFHNTNTQPGPITPISNFKQVLKYAANTIPAEKIVVGLPLYGYDWGKENTSIEHQNAKGKIEEGEGNFIRDQASLELVGKYKTAGDRVIWVEDSESVLFKINLSRFYGIYQFSFWRLGGEDLTLWEKL